MLVIPAMVPVIPANAGIQRMAYTKSAGFRLAPE
jgi:hypothetical protein